MADDLASRADLDRVAAFLRELDRMLHLASTRPSGGYRLAPLVLPPLPPTTGFGDAGRGTGRGGSGWMATREPTAPLPGPAPDMPWVEPPPDDGPSLPAPAAGVVSTTPEPPVRRRVPAATPVPQDRRTVLTAPAAPADDAEATRAGPARAPGPTASPVPTRRPVTPHGDSPGPPQPVRGPEPTVERASGRPTPASARPSPETRPRTEPTLPVPDPAPGPVLASHLEPAPRASRAADSGPTTRPRPAESPAPDVRELPRTTPSETPEPARPPEPVDLVIEGIDAAPTPGSDVEGDADLPADPADDAVVTVAGPPVPPGGRGPRRERARLSFATAGRVQTELQRMYLDRTLRRFR